MSRHRCIILCRHNNNNTLFTTTLDTHTHTNRHNIHKYTVHLHTHLHTNTHKCTPLPTPIHNYITWQQPTSDQQWHGQSFNNSRMYTYVRVIGQIWTVTKQTGNKDRWHGEIHQCSECSIPFSASEKYVHTYIRTYVSCTAHTARKQVTLCSVTFWNTLQHAESKVALYNVMGKVCRPPLHK